MAYRKVFSAVVLNRNKNKNNMNKNGRLTFDMFKYTSVVFFQGAGNF